MSYRRYAGDKFIGPTGIDNFPTDVADGATLTTTGVASAEYGQYIKAGGVWRKLTESEFVQLTGTTSSQTSTITLTGLSSIYDIRGVYSGQGAFESSSQVRCFVGGVLQNPANYNLEQVGSISNIVFDHDVLSGVRTQVLYHI
ncbi:MAG: hypothetical protein CMD25_04065 [Flavobacteriales bacterium]|nr:hypothetical protein [Flavobacteriales bacterium]|tara:strand:- start:2363 stop:2791 length:429 start_codon:yes stop_codon:yes gene_type:complete